MWTVKSWRLDAVAIKSASLLSLKKFACRYVKCPVCYVQFFTFSCIPWLFGTFTIILDKEGNKTPPKPSLFHSVRSFCLCHVKTTKISNLVIRPIISCLDHSNSFSLRYPVYSYYGLDLKCPPAKAHDHGMLYSWVDSSTYKFSSWMCCQVGLGWRQVTEGETWKSVRLSPGPPFTLCLLVTPWAVELSSTRPSAMPFLFWSQLTMDWNPEP